MATITGSVLFDRDRSATRSSGDAGLPGIPVVLQNLDTGPETMPFFTSPPERTAWSRLPTKQMGFPPPPISPARRSGLSLWEAIPPFPRPPIPRQAPPI